MSSLKEFDHLKIQMEDIILATDNFNSDKLIGRGGFGPVYKGELGLPKGRRMVAFKRLDRKFGQGNIEFWKEIMMLSKYKHENLISLMHFCIKGGDMILVYEYASRGSLDHYLHDPSLTWSQRLKICVGVARALHFLHDPKETQQRVVHRDIKSSNILLDKNWVAKVSDFGLSKDCPANQQRSYLISNVAGTPGYCDPLYSETGILSKESDVYSFGVVLFEIICGRLCCEYLNGELTSIFVPKWRKWYEDRRLDEIIFLDLKEQIEPGSLNSFIAIAYRCIKRTREERPTMADVVKELEFAFEQQEIFENMTERVDFEKWMRIADLAVPPLSYTTPRHLFLLLLRGILIDSGQTWFTMNKNEEACEKISAVKCASSGKPQAAKSSRFLNVVTFMDDGIKLNVRTQFLSPHVAYTINVVFGFDQSEKKRQDSTDFGTYVCCRYRVNIDENPYLKPCNAIVRGDGWLVIALYQFTSYQEKHNFKIHILSLSNMTNTRYFVESIEFRPMENETHGYLEHRNKVDMQPIPNSDMEWEEKLPSNYTDIIKLSKDSIQWTTKKELYFLFRIGFRIEDGDKWFSINKHAGIQLMVPAKAILTTMVPAKRRSTGLEWIWNPLPESRFQVVAECPDDIIQFSFEFCINSKLLRTHNSYSFNLIYRLPENHSLIEGAMTLTHRRDHRVIYLAVPRTNKRKGHPKLRNDGWMEVELLEEIIYDTTLRMQFILSASGGSRLNFVGLVVQGIECRAL